MDWQNERYVRLYTRESADMLAVGWHGRAVFRELITKVDRAGILDVTDAQIIAELIRIPVEIVEPALQLLTARGVVETHGNALVIPNFVEAQEAKTSDKERQARSRSKRRDLARNVTKRDSESQNVTNCHKIGENVTRGHTVSHGVTLSLAEPSLATPSHALVARPDVTKRDTKKFSPESLEISKYLLEAIRSHSPEHRAKNSTLKSWALEIDRAIRIDHRTPEQLRAAIDHAHRSRDDFWRPNILSGKKLRSQMDQLAIRSRLENKPQDVRVGRIEPLDFDEYPEPGAREF